MASLEEKYIEYKKDAPPEGALSFKDFEKSSNLVCAEFEYYEMSV